MWWKLLILIFVSISVVVIPTSLEASEEDFFIDINITYQISESGKTTVKNDITIENASTYSLAKSYSLELAGIEPLEPSAVEGDKKLEIRESRIGGVSTLIVPLEEPVIGKGESRTFTISYIENSFAKQNGEIWDISIPRVISGDNFRNYAIKLIVPKSFGQEAYMLPKPSLREQTAEQLIYTFDEVALSSGNIVATFGRFQVFSFALNYYLENPENSDKIVEIALPPDMAFQRMYYHTVDPRPETVSRDEDGNWLAQYKLARGETIEVLANGVVQIYSSPRWIDATPDGRLDTLLSESQFWQVNDPVLQKEAEALSTPQDIYGYVIDKLSYDYSGLQSTAVRKGASQALANPDKALCMEFTDLFIALARASGIPAREVNGFAYTENLNLEPLSLVQDVLHAWPEYYDYRRKVWVPVDPTWGDTSGKDYFNHFDLRHFTFVIHGKDDTQPIAPGVSVNDYSLQHKAVRVEFGDLPQDVEPKVRIFTSINSFLPLFKRTLKVTVVNDGGFALYDTPVKSQDGEEVVYDGLIQNLLPYSKHEVFVPLSYGLFASKITSEVNLNVGENKLTIPTDKKTVLAYQLLVFCLIVILSMGTVWFTIAKHKIKLRRS